MSNVQALSVARNHGVDSHAPSSVTLVVNVKVNEGDWSGYKHAVEAFAAKIPDSAYTRSSFTGEPVLLPEWRALFTEFKRSKLREYLGTTKSRSFKRGPKILTDALCRQLAESNAQERKRREPHFVRIAELYAQIAELEWEIDKWEMDTARSTR
jgi:organic radical activating enzyme